MQLPAHAGVMVLNTVLFPQAVLPLHIFEPRYRAMLAHSLDGHRMFVVAMRRLGTEDSPCQVAGLGLVRASIANPNGTSNLILQGISRVRLGRLAQFKPFKSYHFSIIPPANPDSIVVDALRAKVLELAAARVHQGFPLPLDSYKESGASTASPSASDFLRALSQLEDTVHLADLMACLFLKSRPKAMQRILESPTLEERLKHLVHLLIEEIVSAKSA